MCLLWAEMGAVDVAFTEATVGAGVSTLLFIATILHTTRRSKD
jgi:energy-converting hydrogenase B subunit D